MTTRQLLKLLHNNRELIQRNNEHALEDLNELTGQCSHSTDEEIILNLELNHSLVQKQHYSNYRKAIENSSRVLEKFKNTTYQNLLSRHRWVIGYCYAYTGEFKPAEQHLLTALKALVPEQREYIPLKADILLSLTMNEQIANKGPKKSIQYLTEALAMLSDDSFPIYKANCLMGLGNVYINAGYAALALENNLAAIAILEAKFDLANMAGVYSNIGTCYIELKDYVLAEKYLEKSLDIRMKVGSPDHLCISYFNFALLYKETNQLGRAHELLLKCRDILTTTGNKPLLADTEILLAEIILLKSKDAVIA